MTLEDASAAPSAFQPGSIPPWKRRGAQDSLFLGLLISLSVSLYVARLGFYSDDWAFLGALTTSPNHSVGGLIARQWQLHPNLDLRPTQIAYQALLYSLFRLRPLGYHLVNGAMLLTMTLMLYWVLRELRVQRLLAVSIPAIFALLPSYSTDRFWFASFGYVLTMTVYLLNLYADLRAIRARRLRSLMWKVVALVTLVLAGLGYEVILPLLALNMLVVWLHARRLFPGGMVARLGRSGTFASVSSHYVVLIAVVSFKALTATGAGPDKNYLFHLARIVIGSTTTNYGDYVVTLPYTATWAALHASLLGLLAGGLVGFGVFVYLTWLLRTAQESMPGRMAFLITGTVGIAVFGAGYLIALTTARVGFSSTGIVNRSSIAAGIGLAVSLVAVIGWFSTLASRVEVRRRIFCGTLAIVCASGFLTINVLATYWGDAWRREQAILATIEQKIPRPASNSTLILDGICPYLGPAIVFETYWDLAGALQARYRDPTLAADVTSSRLTIDRAGLRTTIYGGLPAFHPYGSDLLLFDYRNRVIVPIPDATSAREYFDKHPVPKCAGEPGRGVVLLPMERVFVWWLRNS